MIKNKIFIEDMAYIASRVEKLHKFENKTILITGCAGFLGVNFSGFFAYLFKKGVNIKSLILLDNFILGKPDWLDILQKVSHKIKLYTFDISKDKIESIKKADEVDYVIHMASIASPIYYRKYPIETIDANVNGLRCLLDYYKDRSIEGFLFFSSSEVYGNPSIECIPTAEDYNGKVATMGPRACYDEAKRFGETLCYYYFKIHNIPIRIVRPFNNYGPGMVISDKRVPADFAECVLNNKDITLYSDGKPTRTFCYVADAMVGYLKTLLYDQFDYFNIGIAHPEISVSTLADIFRQSAMSLWGYEGDVIFRKSEDVEYLKDNPLRRCPSIAKAQKHLEFEPEIDVSVGVNRYLKFLKEERWKG